MNLFDDVKYGTTKVTAIAIDSDNNFVWLAFSVQNNSCILKKVSAFDSTQIYYTISVPVIAINAMTIVNGYIFLAVTPQASGTYINAFIFSYSIINPLTTWSYNTFPIGVVESPISLTVDSSENLYLLTPGIESGTFATVNIYTNLNVFISTVDLDQSGINVKGAIGITCDASDNLWIITNENPTSLIRVWNLGLGWDFERTILT